MEQIHVLMESTDNVKPVQSCLTKLIKCHDEANDRHEDVINLVLPKDKSESQIV